MTSIAYLAALLLSLGGLALLDRRFRLAFWADARRASWTIGIGVVAAEGELAVGAGDSVVDELGLDDGPDDDEEEELAESRRG